MIRGLYTSALGMMTQMKRMDVITNNLANVDTTGYKQDGVVTESFPDMLTKRLNDRKNGVDAPQKVGNMTPGVMVSEVYTNFTQGAVKETGDPLSLAIKGTGYFAIEVQDKQEQTSEKYTRDGSFAMGSDGRLMTKEGNTVLGENGPVFLSEGDIRIDEQGQIWNNDQYVDRLKIVGFDNPNTLKKIGNNLLETTENTVENQFDGQVLQGFLESSNVNTVREMVDMITVMRTYEANQKAIQTHDQTLGKAVNEIGRP